MTTTASAIEQNAYVSQSAYEIATITSTYASLRANRPLKGRMGSRDALLGTSILAGAFGLFAAEATAQQYNLPGSGGFTDVSSSINVVTDAGAGNIRVILADGVQFMASPGQYQLNPTTNQLQVSTDVLLGAYTGGAPVQAQQATQVITASQAFTPPPVYAANAPLTLPQQTISGPQFAQNFSAPQAQVTYQPQVFTAGQYNAQPSVVGGYQMQPSAANVAYNPPQIANVNPQPTQYVPAYSAGPQFAQAPQAASTFGNTQSFQAPQVSQTFGQQTSTFGQQAPSTFGQAPVNFGGAPTAFGGAQPLPVSQVVPTNEVAIAPVAAAAAGGLFGLPTWAVLGGGALAAGAGVLALANLSGDSTTSTSNSSTTNSNLTGSQSAFLNNPDVQAALGNTSAGSTATTTGGSTTTTTTGTTTTTTTGGITVAGGTSGGTTTTTTTGGTTTTTGASATITAGSEDQDIGGTAGDDTVTFEAAEDAEEFSSLDLSGGDDTVILQDMDADLKPKDLNNVENLEVQVDAAGLTLDMSQAGDDIETLTVDANGNTVTIKEVDSVDTIKIVDAGDDLVTIEDVASGSTVALTDSDQVKITAGSTLELMVDGVSTSVEIENTTDLTIETVSGSTSDFDLIAVDLENITAEGGGSLIIANDLGTGNLVDVKTFDGSAATGSINIVVDGTNIEDVDLGSNADALEIKGSDTNATYDTGDGNDNVEINAFGTSAVLNTGAGADTIELDFALTSTNQKIDGGDATDTLEVSVGLTSGDYDNIEKVEIGGGVNTINLALLDSELTDVEVETASTVTLQAVRQGVDIDAVSGAQLVLASGTADNATINPSGSLTVTNNSAGSVIDELNFDFSGANAASTLTLTSTVTDKVTITDAAATVTLLGTGITNTATGAMSIDASAVAKSVVVGADGGPNNGAGNISALTTGSGNDTVYVDHGAVGADIMTGAGDDIIDADGNVIAMDYTGGEGKDSIALNNANTVQDDIMFTDIADFVVVTSGTTTNLDSITGFVVGTDKIDLDALNLTGLSGSGAAHATAADAYADVFAENNDVAYSHVAGVTYVYVDLGTTIGAIEVNGVNGAAAATTLSDTDFNL